MDKVKGSMAALSALQLTVQMEGMDAQSKIAKKSLKLWKEAPHTTDFRLSIYEEVVGGQAKQRVGVC